MKLARYVKFREEKFGGVLFETQTEKVYTLNPTAAAVIREIVAGHDAAEIPARLKERFQGAPATIEQEVRALIECLQQKGLIAEAQG